MFPEHPQFQPSQQQRAEWHAEHEFHEQLERNIEQERQMSTFSDLVNTLTQAGLTGNVLTNTVSTIFQNSPRAAVLNACTTILSNSNNPTVIKDMAVKMSEIPNLPVAVANLIPELLSATSPQQVTQVVQSIETAMGHGFLGF